MSGSREASLAAPPDLVLGRFPTWRGAGYLPVLGSQSLARHMGQRGRTPSATIPYPQPAQRYRGRLLAATCWRGLSTVRMRRRLESASTVLGLLFRVSHLTVPAAIEKSAPLSNGSGRRQKARPVLALVSS